MNKSKVPIVAIVGRANVGKSSLFNAVIKTREAIVANEPGTTRDALMAKASIGHPGSRQDFWIVDTAGLKTAEDEFEFTIQEQIIQAADSADIILVMVEAHLPITEEDRRVAKMALKSKKPVMLVANKADKLGRKAADHLQKLGVKQIFLTSVTHARGIEDLMQSLSAILPKASISLDEDRIRLGILGRPNVGKSAIFNTLAKKQQAIVSPRAGTTRDVNRNIIKYKGKAIELIDTAGIRRSGKIQKGIEQFSVLRALSVIEQSDVCLLLMDGNELNVQLDQKIAGMIKEAGKGLILVVSKWDIVEKDGFTRDNIAPQIIHNYSFVPWAPLIFTSSVTGQNISKIYDLVLDIVFERSKKLKTPELNRWLRQVINQHPPAGLKNRQPKLNYMVQEHDNPIPAFKIFGAHTKFLHWSYKRYLEKELRRAFGYAGSAVQLWFIEKHVDRKEASFK
ncbi:ribosome biogenesis GTPase Der [Candidatus Parcubacteria bacterium]|nr:ribosome biogenesis GTPase Der [Candidatus Parcubacteria bacterium]